MSILNVYWQHTGFSADAGTRDDDEIDGTDTEATRTGFLSDEHEEVTDDGPVIVEDVTNRVYRSSDLPPGTRVIVSDANRFADPIIEHARQAGFHIERADTA